MNLLGKPIDQLSPADIQALKDNSVAESQTIEYKLTLHGNSDSDKREMCADISSFANTAGGYLIYGIDEAEGVPTSIPGLSDVNRDKEQLRIEQTLRSGLDPRLPSLSFKWIDMPGAGAVLLVAITRSWQTPHMVTLGGVSRFHARHSKGKFQMGVSEIRSAMLQAENGRALFTRWRNERVAMLLAGESPAQIPTANGKVVLHLAPFVSSVPGYSVDVNALIGKFDITRPLTSGGHGNRYNLDGVLTYGISREHETGYIQFFRDGRIEIVDASLLCERRGKNGQVQLYIPGTRFEEDIINVLKRMISAFQLLNVQPPIALMLSIVNAKGYEMFAGSDFSDDGQRPIGREVLAFPDFVWNEIPKNVDSAVKPMLDLVWNACGWRGSMNYDENGLRETRRQ